MDFILYDGFPNFLGFVPSFFSVKLFWFCFKFPFEGLSLSLLFLISAVVT